MSTVFEPYVPNGIWPNGTRGLQEEHVGATVVLVDPVMGLIEFRREGVEVPCVCDPERGVVCGYHQGDQGPYRVVFGGR
jgi:hypothetical protein